MTVGQRVSDSVVIEADRETVFAVIADVSTYDDWVDGIERVEVLEEDADGRPLRAAFTVDARVVQMTYTLAYTHDAPREQSWSLVEGETVRQLDGSYRLEEQGEQTKVTYELEVDVDVPLPGFMKKRAAKTILDQGLAGLRRRVEG